jgi:hypothetical protein
VEETTVQYTVYEEGGELYVRDTTDGYTVYIGANGENGYGLDLAQEDCAELVQVSRDFTAKYKTAPVDGAHQL